MQSPLVDPLAPYVCTVFCEYDGQRQLVVGVGAVEENAVDHVADKMSMKFSIKKADLLQILRPIILKVGDIRVLDDSGDMEDIPF